MKRKMVIFAIIGFGLIAAYICFNYVSTLQRHLTQCHEGSDNYEAVIFKLLLEQDEFQSFAEKYKDYGTYLSEDKKGLEVLGIWTKILIPENENIAVLHLEKNVRSDETHMIIFLAKDDESIPDYGNPQVFIKIPISGLETILSEGVTNDTIKKLTAIAEKKWNKREE